MSVMFLFIGRLQAIGTRMFVSGHAMHTWAAMTWVRGRESLVPLGSIARAARGATEIAAAAWMDRIYDQHSAAELLNERTNEQTQEARRLEVGRNPDAGWTDGERQEIRTTYLGSMYTYLGTQAITNHHTHTHDTGFQLRTCRATCRSSYVPVVYYVGLVGLATCSSTVDLHVHLYTVPIFL